MTELVADPMVQRMMALERANEIRAGVAGIGRLVRALDFEAGCELVAGLLVERDPRVDAAQVGWLLLAISQVNERQADRWLRLADAHGYRKRVRDLSDRQVAVLAAGLRAAA